MLWLAWATFCIIGLYGLLYAMICISQRYKRVDITPDVFEDFQNIKHQLGANASDCLAMLINEGNRALAKRAGRVGETDQRG